MVEVSIGARLRRTIFIASAMFAPVLAPVPIEAQETPRSEARSYHHASDAPVTRAARLEGEIRVDGLLDEPAWALAEPITDFVQTQPDEGAPGRQRTEFRILIGDDALYVGARLYESDPSRIRARLARRDESVDGDVIAISLDSRHDHISAYYFRVTAGGAIRDGVVGERGGLDLSWDAVWESAVTLDSLGWSAEVRIPLSQIPYAREGDGIWGIQLERFRWNDQERVVFAYSPRTEAPGPARYGHLVGLDDLPAPSRLELLPYVTARGEQLDVADDNPFRSGRDLFASAGVDARYRVTSELTLNATINPDFGQVEVDPAVVNLTAFETFFPERRPFFVEGRQLFSFGTTRAFSVPARPTMFFSRRIGRSPQRPLGPSFAHATIPDQSTIAAATKLTGRTRGGWSMGLLDAVTLRERADYVDENGARATTLVEPLTNYFVGRVRREMDEANTLLGVYASAVNRDLGDDALRAMLRSSGYTAGADVNHSWDQRRWALDASVVWATVQGSETALITTQRSSARYFQRPDAGQVRLDSTRTSLAGHNAFVSLTRTSGTHWIGSFSWSETSPGFEVNDIGFQTQADRRGMDATVGYQETRPGRFTRNWVAALITSYGWNYDGNQIRNLYLGLVEGSLLNFWTFNVQAVLDDRALDDRLTRGGPLALRPRTWTTELRLGSDPRNPVLGNLNLTRSWNAEGMERITAGVELSYNPTSAVRLAFQPVYLGARTPAHFLGAVPDSAAEDTYLARYVFARLKQRELALVTRADWTLSPRLSLQLFLQPLVSAGDFSDFSELRAPRTYDFVPTEVEVPDPSFNIRSLRGNAVVRWEYRPGSTLYFVWQQRREGFEPFGDFEFGRDYGAIFSAKPENVFAVKATYWLAR